MHSNAIQNYLAATAGPLRITQAGIEPGSHLKFHSLHWKGFTWEHDLVLCRPETPKSDLWLLHITGWEPNDFDVSWSQGVADLSGHPVAVLFQIPNQPLWDRTEDDLIAHTFEQYLATGDESWPLLMPMVKSAVAAADVLEAVEGRNLRYVPFGASKRGWTSWLTAACGDPRVAGVAPMLFNHLRMPEQLAKQLEDWGEYSPRIVDYTSRGLEDEVVTKRGRRLVEMMDPVSYADSVTVPKLVIHGSNDPYWTVDATNLYWDDLSQPKWALTVPNLAHAFALTELWTPTLAAFIRYCDGAGEPEKKGDETRWAAHGPELKFETSIWSDTESPEEPYAEFNAVEHRLDGITFQLTTPVKVVNSRRTARRQ